MAQTYLQSLLSPKHVFWVIYKCIYICDWVVFFWTEYHCGFLIFSIDNLVSAIYMSLLIHYKWLHSPNFLAMPLLPALEVHQIEYTTNTCRKITKYFKESN